MSSGAAHAPAKERSREGGLGWQPEATDTTGVLWVVSDRTTVGEIAAALPAAIAVFENYGIDYACGGNRAVGQVCRAAGLSLAQVLFEIEAARATPPAGPDWNAVPLRELVYHIVDEHHQDQRMRLYDIEALLRQLPPGEEAGPPDQPGQALRHLVDHFRADLRAHMRREEHLVFPAILALEEAGEGRRRSASSGLRQSIGILLHEHMAVDWVMRELRRIGAGYARPAGEAYRALYENLNEFEARMRLHLHLENNVLFPRALRVEVRPT